MDSLRRARREGAAGDRLSNPPKPHFARPSASGQIARRKPERPDELMQALHRRPDEIKVVVQFSEE
jgi:hypothetical protein